jgi:hypothetical protein
MFSRHFNFMMKKKKTKEVEDVSSEPVGGIPFFVSLLVLIPIGLASFSLALGRWRSPFIPPTATFLLSVFGGAIVGHSMIRGALHVFLHELKHQIPSNLVGNKGKGIKFGDTTGSYTYQFSKKTRSFNAFISLAPYCLPLFTFVTFLTALLTLRENHIAAVALVGLGYGIDLTINVRDISPIQTDLTNISGGYRVGLAYIAAWHFALLGVLLSWVFEGLLGVQALGSEFGRLFIEIHAASLPPNELKNNVSIR